MSKIMFAIPFGAILVTSICCFAVVSRKTATFEPDESVLSGSLAARTWWGAPNFGEDPLHDKRDQGVVLVLSEAIDVLGRPGDALNSLTVPGVSEIQLIGRPIEDLAKPLPPERVVVRGRLFTALSGQHHTKVVMEVRELSLGPSGHEK